MAKLNIPQAFAHAFSHYDLEGIAALLEDDLLYDGGMISKQAYLKEMEKCFEGLKARNIPKLKVDNINCKGCNKELTGFAFINDAYKEYYSFVLEVKDNKLTDLLECSVFGSNIGIHDYKQVLVNIDFDVDPDDPFSYRRPIR